MVDLNDLDLQDEQLDVASETDYKDAEEFPPPIDSGIYLFRQGEPTFKNTQDKFLRADMRHEVAEGPFTGRQVYDSVSDKPFERNGVKVSMAHDHLRAVGDRTPYRTHKDIATAIAHKSGQLFRAATDWEATCSACVDVKGRRLRVRGMRRFPIVDGGGHTPAIACPGCSTELRAFSRITRRIPA